MGTDGAANLCEHRHSQYTLLRQFMSDLLLIKCLLNVFDCFSVKKSLLIICDRLIGIKNHFVPNELFPGMQYPIVF